MNAALPKMTVTIAFVSLTAFAALAQSEAPPQAAEATVSPAGQTAGQLDDAWATVEPRLPDGESHPLKRRSNEGAARLLAGNSDSGGRPWLRTLGALAGVIGLIAFLALGYRAMTSGKLSLLAKLRRPGLIEIVSRMPLSARQSLCLVRIGPRLVLIGQSHDTLRALDVIDDADLAARLVGEAAQQRDGSSRAAFRSCLEREAEGYRPAEDDLDETLAPDARRVADVQQGVADTIRRIRQSVARG
jgi:flagellar biogenesis protein FliO